MHTEAAEFQDLFLKLNERSCRLKDMETTTDTENASISNYFVVGFNSKSKYDERTMF